MKNPESARILPLRLARYFGTSVEFWTGIQVQDETTLYGMTYNGGAMDNGVIFKFDTDGNNFSLLHSFESGTEDGRYPNGSLTLSGSKLYGMTYQGVSNNYGAIFRIDTAGTNFEVIHSFDYNTDGAWPQGTLAGTLFYGMTTDGGDNGNDYGTLFALSGYTAVELTAFEAHWHILGGGEP